MEEQQLPTAARRRLLGAAVAGATVAAVLAMGAPVANAVSAPEVVAEGLDNPYKLTFGPDGDLCIAESGAGGEGPCSDPPAGPDGDRPEVCYGASGAVTKVVGGDGAQSRVATGLPSFASEGEAVGPVDVQVAGDGTMYVAVGLGGNLDTRDRFGAGGAEFGTILRIPPGGAPVVHADLAAFEAANDPDADQPGAEAVGEGGDSNPFGIELLPGGTLFAVDAGGNDLLQIPSAGTIELVAVLPFGEAPAPPFIGAPPGTMLSVQPVPTAVARAADGDILVSELTGFPFPAGGADVLELAGADLSVRKGGFSAIMDIATDAEGNTYVAELAHSGLLAEQPDPRISQIRPDGTVKVLMSAADLQGAPTGLTVGPDGHVYVSLGLTAPGEGRVIRFDPSVASDAAASSACPPDAVPGTSYSDIGESLHREAIQCLSWWGIVSGVTADTFLPGRMTTRGELASMVARLLEEAGVALPAAAPDAFPDDEGSVHEGRIDQLAALGVLTGFTNGSFGPGQPMTRAQLASTVVRAHAEAFGTLPAAPDAFTDDEQSVHEPAIDAAAAAGWVQGTSATTFDPAAPAIRAQVSSILARLLASVVAEEGVALPS